jgi:hypothetical protein
MQAVPRTVEAGVLRTVEAEVLRTVVVSAVV